MPEDEDYVEFPLDGDGDIEIPDELLFTEKDQEEYKRPFPAGIATDCRPIEERGPEGDLGGLTGICLGMYEFNPDFKRLEELVKVTKVGQPLTGIPNPLIYVPSQGAYIWGVECYWGSLEGASEKVMQALKQFEQMLARGHDQFLDAVLAEVQEIFYQKPNQQNPGQ